MAQEIIWTISRCPEEYGMKFVTSSLLADEADRRIIAPAIVVWLKMKELTVKYNHRGIAAGFDVE